MDTYRLHKMPILPKSIYKFNAASLKIPKEVFSSHFSLEKSKLDIDSSLELIVLHLPHFLYTWDFKKYYNKKYIIQHILFTK